MLSRSLRSVLSRAARPVPHAARGAPIAARALSMSRDQIKNMSNEDWEGEFTKATVDLAKMDIRGISYKESAQRMRELLKTGLLRHTDLESNPERFFLAHRLLALHAPQLGPGFWIRFTVHYNLMAGSVLGLGSPAQVSLLDDMQDAGDLGCFSLTEKLAGVSSGLVVMTTATWDAASQTFELQSPAEGAYKNWISQGIMADKTVVVADLLMDGKSYGPHAFLMNLREGGEPVKGVTTGDMGRKTIGNDLDNAWIKFDKVKLPKSALLNRYADVEGSEYIQKVKGMPVFHMIGQRLFTGRVAVAQAALMFRKKLFETTKAYASSKQCWTPKGNQPLINVPQIKDIFAQNDRKAAAMEAFLAKCESRLCQVLRENAMPQIQLVEAIAVAKVKAVEESIVMCHNLQNEIGSYALMSGTGFEQKDFLTCCKFAEGDSRVLMQKMSRDRVKLHSKKPSEGDAEELRLCQVLTAAIEKDKVNGWDDNFESVYELAELIMARTMAEFMAS
eukprot:CAMPEP_0173377968 /NCGR_PEP_ID=MMETSP1356-20130122/1210_1 /TAXON_ID=77927 ORGANISM="Hemiselmis virescens, Strain PCC157" /NCGR_SAMPLE_ID=MMETSP1356 /ASSEMBLY_ACC=CAM_ASM_000847 /LENGTH=503 /DNA_ID=CAMNT_0014330893 /DNA_START=67 /DNA_END=1578 /DNA_ORIENTATION=-